jgi:hypothetical protein
MLPVFSILVTLAALFGSTLAADGLPQVPGAKVADLPVGSAQLVHYISSDVNFTDATHVVIVVHGVQRDADNAFKDAQAGVAAAVKQGLVKEDEVVITAPKFFNGKPKVVRVQTAS